MKQRLIMMLTGILTFFSMESYKDLPKGEDGKLDLSADQKSRLKEAGFSEKELKGLQNAADKLFELDAEEKAQMSELEEAREALSKMAEETGYTEEEIANAARDRGGGEIKLVDQINAMRAEMDQLKANNEKLMNLESPAPAKQNASVLRKVEHSATHFLGTGKEYDAFENRPWNQAARDGKTVTATDWSDESNLDLLVKDSEHYYRENPKEIESYHQDMQTLPSWWRTRFGVSQFIQEAGIVTDEVTQARKAPWLPKNRQAIKAETGKVFPVQIDLEFKGYDLQQIETTWLNAWNRDGSSPYKMSFVQFLLSEIDKKARQEDNIAHILGIYSDRGENPSTPGKAIERQNGLLYLLHKHTYIDKKIKVKPVYAPTRANILDHVKDTIEKNIPEEVRSNPNLVYYMSKEHFRWYKTRYRLQYGEQTDFTGDVTQVENYPNITLAALSYLDNTNVHFVTTRDNIEMMEYRRNEKRRYRIDTLKRDTFVYADYKQGIRFKHAGTKISDGDPEAFKVQFIWTNGQLPLGRDRFVTIYNDGTGIIDAIYNNMAVDAGWNADITEIKGQYAGQIIKLRGNNTATKVVKDNANIDLTADFDLSTGGTLTLKVQNDLTVKEVARDTNPPVAPEDEPVEFDGDTVDSMEATEFEFTGAQAQSLASIFPVEDPLEGRTITITGKGNAALTINDVAENIDVTAEAVLDQDGDFVEFTVIDGVFVETNRNIQA